MGLTISIMFAAEGCGPGFPLVTKRNVFNFNVFHLFTFASFLKIKEKRQLSQIKSFISTGSTAWVEKKNKKFSSH